MHVLIDDQKNLNTDIIARNYEAGLVLLVSNVKITHLYIDFDLGPGKTGYDLLKFGFANYLIPEFVQLVTANPVGKKQMANLLFDNGYKSKDGVDYYKELK